MYLSSGNIAGLTASHWNWCSNANARFRRCATISQILLQRHSRPLSEVYDATKQSWKGGGGRVLEIIFKLLTIIHTMKWIDVWLLHISRFSILCWEISIKFRKNKTIKLWQPFSLLIFYFPEVISARFASTIHQIEYVYRYWNRFYWTHRHSALH